MLQRVTTILACILITCSAQAQTFKGFSREPQVFFDEMKAIFEEADKKESKAFMDEVFGPFWLTANPYSAAEQDKIITIAEGLQKKRFRPFPFMKSYLVCIMSFPGSPQEGDGFVTWMKTMDHLLGKSKANLESFLEMSEGLFNDNSFYSSATAVWKSSNAGWKFNFDGKEHSVEFADLNLTCIAKGDSAVIYATSGTYFPTNEMFHGNQGKITWERADLDPNETYAVVQNKYRISMRSSSFKIDSVRFFNPYFDRPLLGEVEDKILANVTPDKATFPQFSSYDQRLSISNIFDKVDYNGGFRMEGANLKGYGSGENPAMITFKRDNLPQMIAYSQSYIISPSRISSSDVRLVIVLNNDSVVHPSISLRYNDENRTLTLVRLDEGFSKSPYYDSYHKLDLYFEALYWVIDDPVIRMGNLFGSSETRAAFESSNYFKMIRYTSLQGMDKMNPLYGIRQYARRVNSDILDAEGVANAMGFRLENYVHVLVDLANKGFLSYDIPTQTVEIRPKLYDYISAAAGNVDYDVLLFNSDMSDGKNAELNLINYDLVLRGVDQIQLSDSQNVAIFPTDGVVNVRKNRDFNFGGVVRSGKFEFYGQEYFFNYDKFQIDLIAVDSCRMYVEDFDPTSKRLRRVKNVIEGVGGTLQVDNPFNKSGMQEEFTEYPILTCDRPSFVYYDNAAIQKGAYSREEVFFELEPFVIDSLDNFATEQIALAGKFVSGGIFPVLDEKIGVQQDYSLGFVRATPSNGLPLYGSKAVFKDDIIVNYNGIQGNGAMEFLTSISESDQFVFFPDSTRGVTRSFVNAKQAGGPETPEAHADAIDLAFYPATEVLSAGVLKNPISMYEGQGNLIKGKLNLSPTGLNGDGIMEFSGAELESDLISYKIESFDSDTASFRLQALTESSMAFKTDDVNAHVDFTARVAEFKSNGAETKVEFPVNEYFCYMDEFKWFMDRNDISLESSREMLSDFVIDTELDMNRSNFFSTAEGQDSLNFMAPKAVYDLKTNTITATDIPYIRLADAKITPSDGQVIIRRRAKIDPLQGASILANFTTQYHNIQNAVVTPLSRKRYSATGEYYYLDENKKPQLIKLTSISVDTTFQTVATGSISSIDEFFLSPHFEYQGDVDLLANEKFLTFRGSTRIIHNCDGLDRNWMNFTASINPEEVLIPVDTTLTDNRGKNVEIGMNLANEPYEIYGTFLSATRDEKDLPVITSRGFLTFNKGSQTYEVGSREKLQQKNLPGNFVSLAKESCELSAKGRLELGEKLGQFEVITLGKLDFKPANEKVDIQASMVLDFYFNDDALAKMEEYLSKAPDLKPVDFTKSNYEYAVRELMGLTESDKVISELSLSGSLKRIPDALSKSLFISDIDLTWDPALESFVSRGDIGIASIGKKQFFRKVPGKIVVEKKLSGDVVHIYLEVDDANWYYFNYSRGLLQAFSSDKDFNNILMETKEDKRKKAGEKKEFDFTYMLGSRSKQTIFADTFMF